MSDAPLILYRAAAVRDWLDTDARPGVVAVREHRILAAGDEISVLRTTGRPDRIIELGDVLLMPGMVNAHAHLDLTHQPRVPFKGDFIDWLKGVIQSRITDEQAIAAAVHAGLRMSHDSGVRGIADIAGSVTALNTRLLADRLHAITGISFLEVVGFGERGRANVEEAIASIRSSPITPNDDGVTQVDLALQPHAPYSTGLDVYLRASGLFPLLSTHLAETLEEAQFIRDATGPFADLLKRLGKWDDSIQPKSVSPVDHLRPILANAKSDKESRWLVAHCNYVDDDDIRTLADTQTSVAYCPVASDYFHHRHHRYRDMLEAGVNVCLGTDSIICQPADEPQPLSILAQMRHLYRRDRTDPALLLRMATLNGAHAIGRSHTLGMLRPAHGDRFTAVRFDPLDPVDPLIQVLMSREPAMSVGPV